MGALRRVAEADRHSGVASARGAADAVHVALGDIWQIKVNDMCHVIDVDPRAAMSVAINTRTLPFLNAAKARSR